MSDETPEATPKREPAAGIRRRQALTKLGLTTAAVYSAPVLTRLWGHARASYGEGGGEYGGGDGGEYGGGEGGEFGDGGEFGGGGPCSAPPCGHAGGKGRGGPPKKHWSHDG